MADAAPPEAPPQKFSRYRSVRRAQANQGQLPQRPMETPSMPTSAPAVPPLPSMDAPDDAPVSRSRSRYHRRPTTSHAQPPSLPPQRAAPVQVPAQPAPKPLAGTSQNPTPARNRALSSPYARTSPNNASARIPNTSRARAEAAPLPTANSRPRTARDEAKQLIQDEAERQKRVREKMAAEKRAKLKAQQAEQAQRERQEQERREAEEAEERIRVQREAEEAEELRRQQEEKERGRRLQKAESAKRQQEREEAEQRARIEGASRNAQPSPPVSPPRQGGRFGIFARRKDSTAAAQSPPSSTVPRQTSLENKDMDTIRPGGGGAVLGIDAPISAVNAGDRRVTILCNKKRLLLPVTPETTAHDLLKSAATCLTEAIDVHSDILVENFAKAGLQRPLRMYEHVRDVMNSWDSDTQNDLEILSAERSSYDRKTLLSAEVPSEKPQGMGFFSYHSNEPGNWRKRFVSLRPDGQLVMAKNETAKDQRNLCHMSDFDVYEPTEQKNSRIKPPKKCCFAVKSQQKSNIFSDGSSYVHFFSTSDTIVSQNFRNALHTWRNWHLKYVMGEGQKKSKLPENKPTNAFLAKTQALGSLDRGPASGHARNPSETSFYQLGSFKPFFDPDDFGMSLDSINVATEAPSARTDTRAMHARKMSTRQKSAPPVAFNRSGLVDDIPDMPLEKSNSLTQNSARPDDKDAFSPSGLLGRTYSQRQRTAQEREAKSSGPFTEGPSLVGNIDAMIALQAAGGTDSGLGRRASVRSTHQRTSSDLQRNASTRAMPKPLVDLTPQYQEPPQHRNKGRGFVPEGGGGPLIENATSIEEAIRVPPSTDWRARPTTARPHGTYGAGSHERTRSLRGRGEGLAAYTVNNHTSGIDDTNTAFTGGGLLARAGFSQGDHAVGRGVMDGSKARGPMIDLNERSQFGQGSLLATVERQQGIPAPIIDRDG